MMDRDINDDERIPAGVGLIDGIMNPAPCPDFVCPTTIRAYRPVIRRKKVIRRIKRTVGRVRVAPRRARRRLFKGF